MDSTTARNVIVVDFIDFGGRETRQLALWHSSAGTREDYVGRVRDWWWRRKEKKADLFMPNNLCQCLVTVRY
jgi:hypothetical protein